MATSELLTTEDIDALDTVIQLKPHQKDIEFTNVTKTDEGDLVSLDELYEKTGQESIEKIIEGFNSLITRNKLKREHGLLLKVNGAESWMELPDRMNAVKGGEGFITNLAKGFVKIIMAIIRYIKGIVSWLYVRLKALLGFAKTKEEVKFLYNKSEEFKGKVAEVFSKLGIYGFDPDELVKELPSNVMPSDMMKITKSKFEKTETVMKHYKECIVLAKKFDALVIKHTANHEMAHAKFKDIIKNVKEAINSRSEMSQHSIISIKSSISELALNYLDPTEFVTLYKELAEKFYGIQSTNLGVDNNVNALKEKINNEIESIRIPYNKDLFEESIAAVKEFIKPEVASTNRKIGPKAFNYLDGLVTVKDAELIEGLSLLTGDPSIKLTYIEFSNTVKQYGAILDSTCKIISEIELTLIGLAKLYTKVNVIVCSLASGDLSNLKESLDLLSEEEKKKLDKEDPDFSIFHFKTLNKMFYEKHPTGHVEKAVSDFIAMTLEDKNFGRVLKSFGNYMKDINR